MGYTLRIGDGMGCGRWFGSHPHQVPSVVVEGVREPVGQACGNRVNPIRSANRLAEIVPLPGAYEPQAEDEW